MLFSDTEQQYGSLSRSLVWITLLLARSNYFHHILLVGMEEVESDDSATSRSTHYLSTPVSQMWQANLWHLQVGFGTWPLLVCLLEGRSKASLRVYWESPAGRYQRGRGCARRGAPGSSSCYCTRLRKFALTAFYLRSRENETCCAFLYADGIDLPVFPPSLLLACDAFHRRSSEALLL